MSNNVIEGLNDIIFERDQAKAELSATKDLNDELTKNNLLLRQEAESALRLVETTRKECDERVRLISNEKGQYERFTVEMIAQLNTCSTIMTGTARTMEDVFTKAIAAAKLAALKPAPLSKEQLSPETDVSLGKVVDQIAALTEHPEYPEGTLIVDVDPEGKMMGSVDAFHAADHVVTRDGKVLKSRDGLIAPKA